MVKKILFTFSILLLGQLAISQAPTVISFFPQLGPIGTSVTILGSNFNIDTSNNTVYIGGVKATVTAASANSITAIVPAGALFVPISVKTDSLTAVSAQPFVVTFAGSNGTDFRNTFFENAAKLGDAVSQCIADFDNDGKLDIATSTTGDKITVYKNFSKNGVPDFILKASFFSIYGADHYSDITDMIAADLTGDGKPELLVIAYNSSTISIYKNTSTNGDMSFDAGFFYSFAAIDKLPYSIAVADMDNDGKNDLLVSYVKSGRAFEIAQNTSQAGNISFGVKKSFSYGALANGTVGSDGKIAVIDIDGDNKQDVVSVCRFDPNFFAYLNRSTIGFFNFASGQTIISDRSTNIGNGFFDLKLGDINGDNKPDIVYTISDSSILSVYKNNSSLGAISFAAKQNFIAPSGSTNLKLNDMDGDGKLDVVTLASYDSVAVIKNNSTSSNMLFALPKKYITGSQAIQTLNLADMDADGKVDIIVGGTDVNNSYANKMFILRNNIGDPVQTSLCTFSDSAVFVSNISGSSYQWQLNNGMGFINVADNLTYSGSTTNRLVVKNIPSNWYGYQYRCVVDGNYSDAFIIKMKATWVGGISGEWENAGNWACRQIPDINTDVKADVGYITISSNAIIRSLKLNPGVTMIVTPGFSLTISR